MLVWFQENQRGARLSAIGFGSVLAVLPTEASLYLWDAGGRKLRYKLIDFSIDDRLLWACPRRRARGILPGPVTDRLFLADRRFSRPEAAITGP